MEAATQVLVSATSHIVLLLALLPACGAVLVHLSRRAGGESVYYIAVTNAWTGQFLALMMLFLFLSGTLHNDPVQQQANRLVSSLLWQCEIQSDTAISATANAELTQRSQPRAALSGPPVRILLGAGGINIWLIVLTVSVSVVFIQSQPHDHQRLRRRLAWILLTESSLLVSIAALDLLLLSFSSLLSVVGLTFLIAEFGGRQRREAARRFFITQLTSGMLLTIGLTGIAISHWWMQVNRQTQYPALSFSLTTVVEQIPKLAQSSQPALEYWNTLAPWLFLIIGAGIFIRLPIPPLHHGWMRVTEHADCRVVALIAVGYLPLSMQLLLRVILPLFPEQSSALAGHLAFWGVAGSLFLSFTATTTQCRQRRLATLALSVSTAAVGVSFLQQPTVIQGAALSTVALAAACALAVLCRASSDEPLSSGRNRPTDSVIPAVILQWIPVVALAGLSLMPLTAGFWGILLVLEGLFFFAPTLTLVLLISYSLTGWTAHKELLTLRRIQTSPKQQSHAVSPADKPGTHRISLSTLIPLTIILAVISLCPRLVLDHLPVAGSDHRSRQMETSQSTSTD